MLSDQPGSGKADTATRSPTAAAFAALRLACCACRSVDSTLYVRKPACRPRCPSCLKPADFCCSCFCCECCADCCCKCCDLRRSICCAGAWQLTLGGMIGSGYTAITALSFHFQPAFVVPNAAYYALLIHLLVFWWLYCLTGIVGCCTSLDRQGIVTYDPRVILLARVYLGLNLLCAVCHVTLALLNRGLWGQLLTRINIFLTFLPLIWDWYIVYLAWSFITKLKEQRKGIFRGRPLMRTQLKPGELLELNTGHNLELTPPPHQVIVPLALIAPVGVQQGSTTRRGRPQSGARWSAPSGDTSLASSSANVMGRNFRSVIVGAAGGSGVGGVGAADGGAEGDGGRATSRTDRSEVSSVWNVTENSYGGGGGMAVTDSSVWGGMRRRQVRDSDSADGSVEGADQYDEDGAEGDVDGGVGRRYPSGQSLRGEVEAEIPERRSAGRLPLSLPMPPVFAAAAAAAGSQRSGGPEPGLGQAQRTAGTAAEAPSVLEAADSLAAIQEEDTALSLGTSALHLSPEQQHRGPWQQQDGEGGPPLPPPPSRQRRRVAPELARISPLPPSPAGAPRPLGRRTAGTRLSSEGAAERRSLDAASRGRTAVATNGTAAPGSVDAQDTAPAAVFELHKLSTRPSFGAALVSPVGTSAAMTSAGSSSWRSGASGRMLQRGSSGARSGFGGARPRNPPLPTLEPVVLSIPVAATYGGALFSRPHTGRSPGGSGGGFGGSGGGGSGDDGRGGVDRHRLHDDVGGGSGGDVVPPTAAAATPTPVIRKVTSLSRRTLFLQQMVVQRSQAAADPRRGAAAPTDPQFPRSAPDRSSASLAAPGRQGLPTSADAHLLRQRPPGAGMATGGRTLPPQGVPVRMADPDLQPDTMQSPPLQQSPPPPLPRVSARPHATLAVAAAAAPPLTESASGPPAVTLTLAAAPGAVLPPRSGTVSAAASSVHLPSLATARASAADGNTQDGRTSPQDAAATVAALRTATADSTSPPPPSPCFQPLPPPPPPQLPTPTPLLKNGSWNDRYHRSDDGLLPARPSAPTPGSGQTHHRLAQTRRSGSQQLQNEQGQQLHHQQHLHQQQQPPQHQQHHSYQPRGNISTPLPGREVLPPQSLQGSSDGGARSDGGAGNVSDGGGSTATAGGGAAAGRERGSHALGAVAKLLASSSARSLRAFWGDITAPPAASTAPPAASTAPTAPPSPPPQPGKAVLVAVATDIVQPQPQPQPPPGQWTPEQLGPGADRAGGATGSLRTVFQLHARTQPPVPPLQLPPQPPLPPSPVRVQPRAQSYSEPSHKSAARMPRPGAGAMATQFPAAAADPQGRPRSQVLQHIQQQELPAFPPQSPHSQSMATSGSDGRIPSNTPLSLVIWTKDLQGEDAGTGAADGGGGIGAGGSLGVQRKPKYEMPSSSRSGSPQRPQSHHRYAHNQHLRQQRQQVMATRRVGGGTGSTTSRFWHQQQQQQQQGVPGGREGGAATTADPGSGSGSGGGDGDDGGPPPAALLPQGVGSLAARAGASAAALWGMLSGDWRAQKWQDDRGEEEAGGEQPPPPSSAGLTRAAGSAGPVGWSGSWFRAHGTWGAGAARGGSGGGGGDAREVMTQGSVLPSQGGARLGTMSSSLLGPNGLPAAVRTVREGAATLYDRVVPNVSLPYTDRTERGVSTGLTFWGSGWAPRVTSTASTAKLRGGLATGSAGAGGSAATAGSGLSLSFGGDFSPSDSRTTGGALGAMRQRTPFTPIAEITPYSDEDGSAAEP